MVKEDYHRNLSELLPYLQFSLYSGTYFAQVLGVYALKILIRAASDATKKGSFNIKFFKKS